MNDLVTLHLLSDAELDAVSAAHHSGGGGGGNGGTTVQIVEISIGEIVATGNSTLTINLAGIGSANAALASPSGHGHHGH